MAKATYIFAAEQTSSPMTSADQITIEKAFANEADYEVIFELPRKVWIVDFNVVSKESRLNHARLHGKLRRELSRLNLLVAS